MKASSQNEPISQLIALSDHLEARWSRENFPQMALETLAELNFKFGLAEFEEALAEWMLGLSELPKQVNLFNVFGEPSISLFNNDRFSVDVYFWRKNDTLIHSHAFRGAFKVLYGQSLHEEFQVETTDELGEDVVNSKVSREKLEILKTGDTRVILPGMKLVHRILHLDDPTVTLCIRTVNDTELSQWHHLSSGISYQQRNIEELAIKRILYFQFLFKSDPSGAIQFLNQTLDIMSVSGQLSIYEGLFKDEFGLDQETSYVAVDHMRSRFADTAWFSQYEDHYKNLDMHLFESQASKGSLKLLAHAINCNYSKEETQSLLEKVTDNNLKSLCKELFSEEQVFNEEHFEAQQEAINIFAKG